MKKLFLAAATTLLSANSFAMSSDYKFVAVNDTQVTNLCVVAAEQGIVAAKKAARRSGIYSDVAFNATQCNDMSIRRFAAKFSSEQATNVDTTVNDVTYIFKTKDAAPASEVCKIAAESGMSEAIKAGGLEVTSYVCNGLGIQRFARKYKKA